MARNGSGVYVPPAANYPAVSGTLITAADRNAIDADIATALTNSIAVNGESIVTGNIPLGGNKLTGVGAATARADAATLATIQDGTGVYIATVGGTSDVITLTSSPAITVYSAGQLFSFITSGANTTNVTVNVNGLGAKAITKNGTTALVAGDIPSGFLTSVRYDGTQFQLVASPKFTSGTLTGLLTQATGADIASASTVDLTAATGNTLSITGTTTITAFTMTAGQQMELIAVGALPLTYHATTLNINGGVSYTCAAGDRLFVNKAADNVIRVNVIKQDGTPVVGSNKQIQSVDYALAANALTLKLNPTSFDFRSTTLTSGAPVTVSTAAQITTTISSGSTGGTISAVQSDIYILAINNAGTMELAWVNIVGGVNLDETTLINTTAEGGAGAADSATTIYSTTARTGVAFRVVGVFRSTQTTAGTWAQTPSLVQGIGGQALAAMSSLGYGQVWSSSTKVSGTTYYGGAKPKLIQLNMTISTTSTLTVVVGGVTIISNGQTTAVSAWCHSFIVPPFTSYVITATNIADFTVTELS